MSEFKVTGPGRYMTRSEGMVDINRKTPDGWHGNAIAFGCRWWSDFGKYDLPSVDHPRDIIARVDVPQPDAQDRIVGVESPKSLDPLARLEVWHKADEPNHIYEILPDRVELRAHPHLVLQINTYGSKLTIAEAITKALDIAEGVK